MIEGIICFFTGKNPLVNWVPQWLNAMIGRNSVEDVMIGRDSVEDVYKGPRGFFEVIDDIQPCRRRRMVL